jgi:uncharacterized SAM-binding protein YcdF (DUF218 family)
MAVLSHETPHGTSAPEHRWLRRSLRVAMRLAGVTTLAVLIGFAVFASSLDHRDTRLAADVDGIVAVTGGQQRISEAADILATGQARRLLISGVNEKAARDELIRHAPRLAPVMGCCVDLDHRARNTIGNAIEARRWLRQKGYASLAVVTSSYHMPRTLAEFRHAMPGVRLEPVAVVAEPLDMEHWYLSPTALRVIGAEYVKYLAAHLRMLFETDPETSRLATLVGGRKPSSPKPGAQGWERS